MRILLDTNILARAAAGPPGLARELFLLATRHVHTLILSPFLVGELGRVLRYPRLRPVHGLSDEDIEQFTADLVLIGDLVTPPGEPATVSSDPNDDPIIAVGVEGRAEVLCTLDRHLLHPAVKDYCAARGVEVLTDLQLLPRLKAVGG